MASTRRVEGRRRRTSETSTCTSCVLTRFELLYLILELDHIDRTTWALRIACPMSGLATRMTDTECVLLACPALLANLCLCVVEAVAEVVGFFRRPELVCHRSVVDHAHCWAHVVVQMVVETCPCRQENHENVDFGLRLLSVLLEQWQGLPAIQQVSSVLFPTVNCPHLASEHRFHHCLCRWANTSSSFRTYSCKSPGSMVSLPSLSSSSVSTTSSNVSHCADEAE